MKFVEALYEFQAEDRRNRLGAHTTSTGATPSSAVAALSLTAKHSNVALDVIRHDLPTFTPSLTRWASSNGGLTYPPSLIPAEFQRVEQLILPGREGLTTIYDEASRKFLEKSFPSEGGIAGRKEIYILAEVLDELMGRFPAPTTAAAAGGAAVDPAQKNVATPREGNQSFSRGGGGTRQGAKGRPSQGGATSALSSPRVPPATTSKKSGAKSVTRNGVEENIKPPPSADGDGPAPNSISERLEKWSAEQDQLADYQTHVLNVLLLGWTEITRQCFRHIAEQGVLLDNIRCGIMNILSYTLETSNRYRTLLKQVDVYNLEGKLRDLTEELIEKDNVIASLRLQNSMLQEQVQNFEPVQEEVVRLRHRESVLQEFIAKQAKRNTELLQLKDSLLAGNGLTDALKAYKPRNSRKSTNASRKSTTDDGSDGASRRGSSLTDGDGDGDAAGDGADGEDHDDKAGEEAVVVEPPVDAIIQCDLDRRDDDKVYLGLHTLLGFVTGITDTTQSLCKIFYPSANVSHPSLIVGSAKERLADIVSRAMASEERARMSQQAALAPPPVSPNYKPGGGGAGGAANGESATVLVPSVAGTGMVSDSAKGPTSSLPPTSSPATLNLSMAGSLTSPGLKPKASPLSPGASPLPAGHLVPARGHFDIPKTLVAQILKDVNATMKEIHQRITALGAHDNLKDRLGPQMQPPNLPATPCPLCKRVEPDGSVVAKAAQEQENMRIKLEKLQSEKDSLLLNQRSSKMESDKLKKENLSLEEQVAKLEYRMMMMKVESARIDTGTQTYGGGGAVSARRETLTPGGLGTNLRRPSAVSPTPSDIDLGSNGSPFDRSSRRGSAVPATTSPEQPRSHSPPLVLNLVINCHCNDEGKSNASSRRRPSSQPGSADSRQSRTTSVTKPPWGESAGEGARSSKRGTSVVKLDLESLQQKRMSTSVMADDRLPPMMRPVLPLESPRSARARMQPVLNAVMLSKAAERQALQSEKKRAELAARIRQLIQVPSDAVLDAKPKMLVWILKLIGNIYRSKAKSDFTLTAEGLPVLTCVEHLADYLRQTYGTKKLVEDTMINLIASTTHFKDMDNRVQLFSCFFLEDHARFSLSCYYWFIKFNKALDDALPLFEKGASLLNSGPVGTSAASVSGGQISSSALLKQAPSSPGKGQPAPPPSPGGGNRTGSPGANPGASTPRQNNNILDEERNPQEVPLEAITFVVNSLFKEKPALLKSVNELCLKLSRPVENSGVTHSGNLLSAFAGFAGVGSQPSSSLRVRESSASPSGLAGVHHSALPPIGQDEKRLVARGDFSIEFCVLLEEQLRTHGALEPLVGDPAATAEDETTVAGAQRGARRQSVRNLQGGNKRNSSATGGKYESSVSTNSSTVLLPRPPLASKPTATAADDESATEDRISDQQPRSMPSLTTFPQLATSLSARTDAGVPSHGTGGAPPPPSPAAAALGTPSGSGRSNNHQQPGIMISTSNDYFMAADQRREVLE